MRRFFAFLGVVGLLAGASVPAASALPTDAHISIDPRARWVGPTEILVGITYVCPLSFATGGVSVIVSQEATGGSGNGFSPAPCTDEPENVVVLVTGGPFTIGPALAQASIFGIFPAFFFGDFDRRRIQIVL
jgi:hypothetical protein